MENNANLAESAVKALEDSRSSFNPLPVLKENIPQELKDHPYWAVWNAEPRSNGGFDKAPLDRNGWKLRINSTQRWMSFNEAIAVYESGGWDGVGILLTAEDSLLGVDIDKCINDDAPVSKTAHRIVETLATYSEFSPSGTGVRCIGSRGSNNISITGNKKNNVEFYVEKRFLTITGQVFSGYENINNNCSDKFLQMHKEFISDKNNNADVEKVESTAIQNIDSSESGKDFAICCRLAEQGLSVDEIKQQLIATGSNHEKYLRDDYLERTVQNAIAKVAANGTEKPPAQPVSWRTLPKIDHMTVATQEFKEIDWMITDWLRKDTFVGQIVGEQQTGKSYLLTALGYCLAAGRSYGPFVIPKPRRVLYLNVEDPKEQVERRCKTVINEMAFTGEEMAAISVRFQLFTWLGKFGTIIDSKGNATDGYKTLEQAISDFRPDLVIGDTKSRLSGVEENSNDAQANLVRLLEKLTVEYNCVLLLVHHPNKSNPYSSRGGGAWESNIRLSINFVKMAEKEGKQFGLPKDAIASCYMVTCNDNYGGKAEAYFQKDPQTGFPRPCKQAEHAAKTADDWLLEAVKTHGSVNRRALAQVRAGEDAKVVTILESYPDIPGDKKKVIESSIARLIENQLLYEEKIGKSIMLTAKQPVGNLGNSMKSRIVNVPTQDAIKSTVADIVFDDSIDACNGTGSKKNTVH